MNLSDDICQHFTDFQAYMVDGVPVIKFLCVPVKLVVFHKQAFTLSFNDTNLAKEKCLEILTYLIERGYIKSYEPDFILTHENSNLIHARYTYADI